jgi:hypothetical protein
VLHESGCCTSPGVARVTARASPYGVRKGRHAVRFPEAPDHSGFLASCRSHARRRRHIAAFVLTWGRNTKPAGPAARSI